jgi:zinc transport system permease protein
MAIGLFILLTALAGPLARKRARQATEAEERCTLEVPASRSPGDDVKV